MPASRPPSHFKKGFTLLELLLAALITMLLFSVVFFTFSVISNTTRAQAKWHNDVALADAALDKLGRDLTCALVPLSLTNCPFSVACSNNGQQVFFALSFYTAIAPPPVTNGWRNYGIEQVHYALRSSSTGSTYALVRNVKPFRCATTSKRYGEEVLFTRIKEFEILLFDGQTWTNQWGDASPQQLPLAARMKLKLELDSDQPAIELDVLIPAGHAILPSAPIK